MDIDSGYTVVEYLIDKSKSDWNYNTSMGSVGGAKEHADKIMNKNAAIEAVRVRYLDGEEEITEMKVREKERDGEFWKKI